MAKTRIEENKTLQIVIYVPAKTYNKINKETRKLGKSRNAYINQIIETWFADEGEQW